MKLSRMDRVHFVGIGGIGMSGIAEVLLTLGFTVTGSDLRASAVTERLAARGASIALGHAPQNVGSAKVVVTSSAVRRDNPEVEEALRRGVPVIPRAGMLAELMRMKHSVAVAGSHGKTTVTAMLAHIASEAGLDPTAVIGGKLSSFGASARLGRSDLMVVEADESDRSFLLLLPTLAVITNIDWEHVDCYPTLQDLRDAFLQFANRVPFYGACVVCGDDPNVRAILPRVTRRAITYGFGDGCHYRAFPLPCAEGERFEVRAGDRAPGEVSLKLLGRHSVLNALAAVAAAEEMGVSFTDASRALASFAGAERRFQAKGEEKGVRVVDDYGHHPTEIAATLEAARRLAGGRHMMTLFQPHRYTRLAAFLHDFAEVLSDADLVVVTDVYPAAEDPIPGVDGAALVERMASIGRAPAHLCPQVADLVSFAAPLLRAGDLVLTLGAGSITQVGDRLLVALREGDGP